MKTCYTCGYLCHLGTWRQLLLIIVMQLVIPQVLADCNDLPNISGSSNNAPDGPPYPSGITITYSCKRGYIPRNGNQVTCNGDQWDPFDFECAPVNCGEPNTPENGRRNGSLYTFGSAVEFICNTGYTMSGRKTTFCNADQSWSNPTPTCNAVTCPAVVTPDNGRVFPTSQNSFDDDVRYTCNEGYEWSGTVDRRCQADQTWSGIDGECKVIDCGVPANFDAETTSYSPEATIYRSVIVFSCRDGSLPIGGELAECKISGRWTVDAPVCWRKCSLPILNNGTFDGQPETETAHGQSLEFHCADGYEAKPSSSMVTCYNGTWTDKPECQKILWCPDPGLPANGKRTSEPPYRVNTRLNFKCIDGYKIIGSASLVCNADETWSAELPTCQVSLCPDPGLPANGERISEPPYRFNTRLNFKCVPGYKIIGSASLVCNADETWSAELPTCQVSWCPDPGLPANGERTNEPPYRVNTRLNFTCIDGYKIIGSTSLVCKADETWSSAVPTCQVFYGGTTAMSSIPRLVPTPGDHGGTVPVDEPPSIDWVWGVLVACIILLIILIIFLVVFFCDRKVYLMLKRELYNWESKYRGADELQQRRLKSIITILRNHGGGGEKPPLSESGDSDQLVTDAGQVKVTTVAWLEGSLRLERSPGCCPCWWRDVKQDVLAYHLLYLVELALDVQERRGRGIYGNKLAQGDASPSEHWRNICDSKGPCGIVFLPVNFSSLKLFIRKDTVTPSQYQPKFMEVHYQSPDSGSWSTVGVVNVKATHSPLTVPNKAVSFHIYPQVQKLSVSQELSIHDSQIKYVLMVAVKNGGICDTEQIQESRQ